MTEMKQHFHDMIADVQDKLVQLGNESALTHAIDSGVINTVRQLAESLSDEELNHSKIPYAFSLMNSLTEEELRELDACIDTVLEQSDSKKLKEVTGFLKSRVTQRPGDWYGGLFDVYSKSTAKKNADSVEFDVLLPNKRDFDMKVEVGGQLYCLENTVLSKDDEALEVWNRFLEDKVIDPELVLIRPGDYCPVDAKGPSVYYDALRLYGKLFDKLAKDLNPNKSQVTEGQKNLLLISFNGLGVRADAPSVGWVLDELFSCRTSLYRTLGPDGATDISLEGWIEFRANELISRGKLTANLYAESMQALRQIPARLSGVLLFDGCQFVGSRINYNASTESLISHAEMSRLENLFGHAVSWWR